MVPVPQQKFPDGMYLSMEKAELILRMLLDGVSVSATQRIPGVHWSTIPKLPVLAGLEALRQAIAPGCHKSLPITAVMAPGISAHIGDVAGLLQ
jgi:hypothetical protein